MTRSASLGALVLTLGALLANPAAADPLALLGAAGRERGMADAGSATVGGPAALSLNPAGLAAAYRPRITFDLLLGDPRLDGDEGPLPAASLRLLGLGGSVPLELAGLRLGLGLDWHRASDGFARWEGGGEADPQIPILDLGQRQGSLRLGVALDFGGLRLGLGTSLRPATELRTEARADSEDTLQQDSVLRVEPELSPLLGLQWEAGPWALGLTFAGAERATLRRSLSLRVLGPAAEEGLLEHESEWLSQESPWHLTLGLALRPVPFLLLAADLEFARWSELGSPGPQSSTVTEWPGGPAVTAAPQRSDPNYGDTLSPRLGAELELRVHPALELAVRGGYRYEPSPLPPQTGSSTLLDAPRHTLALGLGLGLPRLAAHTGIRPSLDLALRWLLLEGRAGDKDYSALSPWEQGFGGSVLAFGLTLGVRF